MNWQVHNRGTDEGNNLSAEDAIICGRCWGVLLVALGITGIILSLQHTLSE